MESDDQDVSRTCPSDVCIEALTPSYKIHKRDLLLSGLFHDLGMALLSRSQEKIQSD